MIVSYRYMGLPFKGMEHESSRMELREDARVEDFLNAFLDRYPHCARDYVKKASIMVNKTKADRRTILRDGDELLILKTLGGG